MRHGGTGTIRRSSAVLLVLDVNIKGQPYATRWARVAWQFVRIAYDNVESRCLSPPEFDEAKIGRKSSESWMACTRRVCHAAMMTASPAAIATSASAFVNVFRVS